MASKSIDCPECRQRIERTAKAVNLHLRLHWNVTPESYLSVKSVEAKKRVEKLLNAIATKEVA